MKFIKTLFTFFIIFSSVIFFQTCSTVHEENANNSEKIDKQSLLDSNLERISVDLKLRFYNITYPINFDKTKKYPLIIGYHGYGQSYKQTDYYLKNKVNENYILISLNGEQVFKHLRGWNAGNCCGVVSYPFLKFFNDDIKFTIKIINEFTVKNKIVDPKKIFLAGHSNGGMMAYRVACELSNQIAGIASVSGSMNTKSCKPSKKVPIIHFHHNNDSVVKFNGGESDLGGFLAPTLAPVLIGLNTWVKNNSCDETYTTTLEKPNLELIKWTNCKEGSDVVLYKNLETKNEDSTIKSYHSWPGMVHYENDSKFRPSFNVDATEKIIEFFDNINENSIN